MYKMGFGYIGMREEETRGYTHSDHTNTWPQARSRNESVAEVLLPKVA